VVGACGGGEGGGDAWDSQASAFANAICVNDCVDPNESDACVADVTADLDDARVELDDAEEAACLECLRVKAELIPDVEANECESTEDLDEQVFAACDTDPSTDFDDDGDPTNDDDEACAGFP
jgi:hypothetical protein